MFTIQNGGQATGSPQKLFAYQPHVRFGDSRRVGFSKQADGSTDADGTMYLINATAVAGSGSIQSGITTEYQSTNGGYGMATDLYAQNATKVKTHDYWGFNLKSYVYIKLASHTTLGEDNKIAWATSSCFVWKKFFEVTSTTFCAVIWNGTNTAAVVGTIATDGTVTWGTAVAIIASQKAYNTIWVEAVSATKYIAIYQNGANIESRCWTISGTTVTMGTALTMAARTVTTQNWYLKTVGTDKVIACYAVSANCYYCFLTISTTTITNVGEIALSTVGGNPMVAVDTSGAGVAFVYADSGGLGMYAKVGTISGNVATLGTEAKITGSNNWLSNSINTFFENVGASTKYAVYQGANNGTAGGNAIVFTRSSTTFTVASQQVLSNYDSAMFTGTNWDSLPVVVQQGASTSTWYLWGRNSSTATEGVGWRMCELTYESTNDTLTLSNHDIAAVNSQQGIYANANNGLVYGHVGTYDILSGVWSTVQTTFPWYVGNAATIELYNQTWTSGGGLADGSVFATIDTTYKSVAYYRYSLSKAVSAQCAFLKLKKTTAGTHQVRVYRTCLTSI